jgi:3-deoxy-D-manno-octulosonate 8-phosphate phosphatase (KDO 8-P phosphatase)
VKKSSRKPANLNAIKMLVLDVDGVLTDGTIVVDYRGRESKFFNALDGHGIKLWKRAGMKVAFLSGRKSPPTKQQAKELDIDFCLEGRRDKLAGLNELVKMSGLPADRMAYVGDDLPDLPAMRCAGFKIAVANAVDEIKTVADCITKNRGGKGAVREAIEYILKKTGRWNELLKKYFNE